ncbi:MAG: LacI family transcriptional regulator [Butyrivibrio sp.]|jgi:LacI family transcriptional regulator/LacI family repressor for deo operon, udp, cdd, tsx, nupC, and nupG|nr:LacI family transcriptional regulator [Butyrivibrio sp.]
MAVKNVTIYDIAEEAGVSPATVSRVLTGSANVRQDKKSRIEELIQKYNFKPSAVARSLTDTRRKLIGIIATDVRNVFYADLYVACEIAADQLGYTVLLLNSFGIREMEKKQLDKLVEQRVDAVIHLGGAADDVVTNQDYADHLNKVTGSIPVITTGKLDGTDCYRVQIDAVRAMDILLEHLVANGNHRIALAGGRYDVVSTRVKYDRFMEKAGEYRLDVRPEYTDNWGSYNIFAGQQTMDRMFENLQKEKLPVPEAVIAINDQTAAGVIRSIENHGYRIPEDISVVSYDNVDIAKVIEPNITSVDYDFDHFGKIIIETAIAAMDGKKIDRQQYIEPTLIIRRSSDYHRE